MAGCKRKLNYCESYPSGMMTHLLTHDNYQKFIDEFPEVSLSEKQNVFELYVKISGRDGQRIEEMPDGQKKKISTGVPKDLAERVCRSTKKFMKKLAKAQIDFSKTTQEIVKDLYCKNFSISDTILIITVQKREVLTKKDILNITRGTTDSEEKEDFLINLEIDGIANSAKKIKLD